MFDKIVLRRSASGMPITAGQLAEALLYYQNVHVVIDHGTFRSLAKAIGISTTLGLLRRPGVSAVHCEESVGTHTESVGAFQIHSYLAFSFAGNEKAGGTLPTRQQRLAYLLEEEGTEKKAARRFAERFCELVPVRRLTGDHYIKGGVTFAAKADLEDAGYVTSAIKAALAAIPGGTTEAANLKFDVIDSDLGLHVFTNIDLDAINRRRATLRPVEDPVTVALFLSYLLDARTDLSLASFYGGDFATSAVTSAVLQVRYSELLKRSGLHARATEAFTEVVLPDTPSLREVIDSGQRSFQEFLILLDKADRFKHWLKGVNPDEGLVRTYLSDVSSDGWIQRLPAKSIRYVITSALDKLDPVAGVLAGLADNFLVEKLLGGWRPNHFVDSRLRPFIESGAGDA